MKTNKWVLILLILVLGLGFAGSANAQALPAQPAAVAAETGPASRLPDQVIVGENYTLKSGETLTGNLWVVGGNVSIEPDARITGDIRLLGGNLTVDGEVDGNIAATGGVINLNSGSIVHGNIDMMGTSINQAADAKVEGKKNNINRVPSFTFPGVGEVSTPNVAVSAPQHSGWSFFSFLFWCFMMAALAVLAVMFLPRQVERTAQTEFHTPVIAGGVGCITLIVVPLVLLVIVFTIILIPVSLAGAFLLGVAGLFGWVTIGTEVGHRLAQQFHKEWALPVTAAVGTFLLTFVLGGIGQIPCIGWIVPTLAMVVGLGAVLLTRFGTRPYPEYPAAMVSSNPPPPPFQEPEL
jgi:cytoskeletal protein CcmA (bactofilin family)